MSALDTITPVTVVKSGGGGQPQLQLCAETAAVSAGEAGADGAAKGTATADGRRCYEETARRAERETLRWRYLLEVITREVKRVRKTRVERVRESELPLEKSLPNFNVKRLPAKAQRQLRQRFSHTRKTYWCSGPPSRERAIFWTSAQELIVVSERRIGSLGY